MTTGSVLLSLDSSPLMLGWFCSFFSNLATHGRYIPESTSAAH